MISVITPVYNGDRFIESCIKNVIEQNCSDVEHIIVDGGSTDRTIEIIKQYADQYSHIRWVSEKDRGQSDAMNKGIMMAKGEVLATLNADDFYEPGVLNRVVDLFKSLPEPSLLVGNCNVWSNEGQLLHVNKPQKLTFIDLLLGPDANPFPENPSAYFYHASLHRKIGLYEVEDHYSMDLDFLLRAVQAATPKYVNETWGNFRRLEGSKTVKAFESNQCALNTDRVIKTYHKSLPIPQRWFVSVAYKFYKAVEWPRYRYILDNPSNLFEIIGNKLRKFHLIH